MLYVGSEEVLCVADSRHRTTVNSQQNLKSFIKHSIDWLRAIKRIHIKQLGYYLVYRLF